MAMIDYGALLRVDCKFINKNNGLFMETSDTGYRCESAKDKDGREYDLSGFVLAGDEHFMISFYKSSFVVVSDGKVVFSGWGSNFLSETFYLKKLPDLKISHLDKTRYPEFMKKPLPWNEFVNLSHRMRHSEGAS